MSKPFKIYGGTAKVIAVRRKSGPKRMVNRGGYTRLYPKKVGNRVIMVRKHIKPYSRSLAGTIKRLRIIKRGMK